ncbi:MAG TPA: hypothetical protein VJN88_10575 [Ktedonobacterales bacterium]|nr:hypothetical protein [Ktedonobacterales bacterium]
MSGSLAHGVVSRPATTRVRTLNHDGTQIEPDNSCGVATVAPEHTDQTDVMPPVERALYNDEGREDFESFGDLLLYLRQTYGERIRRTAPESPHVSLTALAVAEFLKEHGYSMTSGSYSLLEQGKTLPKNPEQFLDVISKCLGIDRLSKYWPLLRFQYLFDHARRYVDRDFAERHVPRGQHVITLLRDGNL